MFFTLTLIGCTLTKSRPSVEWSYSTEADEHHSLVLKQVVRSLAWIKMLFKHPHLYWNNSQLLRLVLRSCPIIFWGDCLVHSVSYGNCSLARLHVHVQHRETCWLRSSTSWSRILVNVGLLNRRGYAPSAPSAPARTLAQPRETRRQQRLRAATNSAVFRKQLKTYFLA